MGADAHGQRGAELPWDKHPLCFDRDSDYLVLIYLHFCAWKAEIFCLFLPFIFFFLKFSFLGFF